MIFAGMDRSTDPTDIEDNVATDVRNIDYRHSEAISPRDGSSRCVMQSATFQGIFGSICSMFSFEIPQSRFLIVGRSSGTLNYAKNPSLLVED